MPGPGGPWGEALLDAVERGLVPPETVREKARRVLRLAARVGAFTEPGATSVPCEPRIPPNDSLHAAEAGALSSAPGRAGSPPEAGRGAAPGAPPAAGDRGVRRLLREAAAASFVLLENRGRCRWTPERWPRSPSSVRTPGTPAPRAAVARKCSRTGSSPRWRDCGQPCPHMCAWATSRARRRRAQGARARSAHGTPATRRPGPRAYGCAYSTPRGPCCTPHTSRRAGSWSPDCPRAPEPSNWPRSSTRTRPAPGPSVSGASAHSALPSRGHRCWKASSRPPRTTRPSSTYGRRSRPPASTSPPTAPWRSTPAANWSPAPVGPPS